MHCNLEHQWWCHSASQWPQKELLLRSINWLCTLNQLRHGQKWTRSEAGLANKTLACWPAIGCTANSLKRPASLQMLGSCGQCMPKCRGAFWGLMTSVDEELCFADCVHGCARKEDLSDQQLLTFELHCLKARVLFLRLERLILQLLTSWSPGLRLHRCCRSRLCCNAMNVMQQTAARTSKKGSLMEGCRCPLHWS